jgi:thiamine-monophosphate kinase
MQEFDFIRRTTGILPNQAEGLICGMGDDCAVFAGNAGRDWLISTDTFSEGVHFRRDWMSATDIGRRSLVAAVSDIAAMGGRPRYSVVAIAVPRDMPESDAMAVMEGMASSAAAYQMVVIGGDTTTSLQDLHLTLTVIGDIRHGAALYRRGSRVGDGVYVTGTLGGALAGLRALQSDRHSASEVDRFLHPMARVTSGQWLADTGCVRSMIDVSDGLIQDLGHVAEASGVGIVVNAEAVPCWREDKWIVDLQTACASGEEYELAFTVDGPRDGAFQRLLPAVLGQLGHPITRIGTVVAGAGVVVRDNRGRDVELDSTGYTHGIGRST